VTEGFISPIEDYELHRYHLLDQDHINFQVWIYWYFKTTQPMKAKFLSYITALMNDQGVRLPTC
jgi:hypothetical protein